MSLSAPLAINGTPCQILVKYFGNQLDSLPHPWFLFGNQWNSLPDTLQILPNKPFGKLMQILPKCFRTALKSMGSSSIPYQNLWKNDRFPYQLLSQSTEFLAKSLRNPLEINWVSYQILSKSIGDFLRFLPNHVEINWIHYQIPQNSIGHLLHFRPNHLEIN